MRDLSEDCNRLSANGFDKWNQRIYIFTIRRGNIVKRNKSLIEHQI